MLRKILTTCVALSTFYISFSQINNIEQIVIENPVTGAFTANVKGTAVASGPQEYIVVYDIIPIETKIVFPIGNETWVPGETETIQWESYGHRPALSACWAFCWGCERKTKFTSSNYIPRFRVEGPVEGFHQAHHEDQQDPGFSYPGFHPFPSFSEPAGSAESHQRKN